jgi:hypothetical protein
MGASLPRKTGRTLVPRETAGAHLLRPACWCERDGATTGVLPSMSILRPPSQVWLPGATSKGTLAMSMPWWRTSSSVEMQAHVLFGTDFTASSDLRCDKDSAARQRSTKKFVDGPIMPRGELRAWKIRSEPARMRDALVPLIPKAIIAVRRARARKTYSTSSANAITNSASEDSGRLE